MRRFLERCPCTVRINRKVAVEPPDAWCTNERLRSFVDFALLHGAVEVLGFHDGPNNMWADDSALTLVQQLAQERLLRFSGPNEVAPSPRGFLHRLLSRVFGT